VEVEGGEDVKAQRSDDRDGIKRELTLDEQRRRSKRRDGGRFDGARVRKEMGQGERRFAIK